MEKKIVINFKNILSELESKNIKLCFIKNRGLYIEDSQDNLYQMELYRAGTYLDKLIKDGIVIEFDLVEKSISQNIRDWERDIWGITEVNNFMTRQNISVLVEV